MVRLIRACSYSDYQISMTIRNATDFFRCWTGFPTRYFSISDSKNLAAAVWKTALTGAWGSTSTSRKPSVPWKRNGWFFAFVYTDALLAAIIPNLVKNSLSRLLCYTDFSKKPQCTSRFGKKSRYNILSFNGKETRVFAKVGITKSIFPFLFFLYNVDYRATWF